MNDESFYSSGSDDVDPHALVGGGPPATDTRAFQQDNAHLGLTVTPPTLTPMAPVGAVQDNAVGYGAVPEAESPSAAYPNLHDDASFTTRSSSSHRSPSSWFSRESATSSDSASLPSSLLVVGRAKPRRPKASSRGKKHPASASPASAKGKKAKATHRDRSLDGSLAGRAAAAGRQPYRKKFKDSRVDRGKAQQQQQHPAQGRLDRRSVAIIVTEDDPSVRSQRTKKKKKRKYRLKHPKRRTSSRSSRSSQGTNATAPSSPSSSTISKDKQSSRGAVVGGEPESSQTTQPKRRDTSHRPAAPQAHGGSSNAASFADQLCAALARSFSQILRRKCDFVLELVVPLLFVAVTIVLWSVWGLNSFGEKFYIDYNNFASFKGVEVQDDLTKYFCYGPGAATPTPGLSPCSSAVSPYVCDGVDTHVPLKGDAVCVYGESFKNFVALYLVSTQGNLTRVPSLDSMILLQWCAMKAGSLLLSDTFGGTFITNQQFYAIDKAGLLYLAGPDDSILAAFEQHLRTESHLFEYVFGGRFPTVVAAKSAMTGRGKNWGIIELREFSQAAYDVVIHLSAQGMASTSKGVDIAYSGGTQENGADLYLASGFLTLAERTAEFYLEYMQQEALGAANYVVSSATPAYSFAPMLRYAYGLVPLIFVLAFLYSVSQQTKRTVLEKEMRIREAMLIMGMRNSVLYVATFITEAVVLTTDSVVITAMVKATFFNNSDVWCLFLFIWVFALTTIPLSGLFASFFSKARLATLMAPVIYFIIVMPTFVVTSAEGGVIIAFSFLAPSGFASVISTALRHQSGAGFAASDMRNPHDDPSAAVLVAILAADFFIYYILMLYFDAVLPKDWGTPKHPLFFIIDPFRACWCCGHGGKGDGGIDGRDPQGVFEDDDYSGSVVEMVGLRKEYRRGGKTFVAVNNVYWGMPEAEISVMLGHNGAGKTTVLNMMTGMIEPDEGDCYVYGLSVRQECAKVRREIGFCPQHNILWPELTCRDHLEFYGRIKGLKGWELEAAVCRMLYETDLFEKRDYKSKDLSGGQKRKLSISIAFVGDSRLVFLDEPTAGMDVGARRHVWALLKSMSQHHTMMLTTHYMDEADLLGQRIGIMSHGRLKCSGSSMFLKSQLGLGYSIIISIDPEVNPEDIDGLVLGKIENSDAVDHNGCELTYRLPAASVDQFPGLLNSIEDESKGLGIRGYSLAATTLEEVFLRVSQEKSHDDDDCGKPGIVPVWDYETTTSPISAQMRAMFVKRFWNALRDRRMQCFQIVCPVVCILVAMLLSLINIHGPTELPLTFARVYEKETQASQFYTAQCDTWWGDDRAAVPGAVHVDTHYANAQNLSAYLFDHWSYHEAPVYGGITCADPDLAALTSHAVSNVFIYNSSGPHQSGINMAVYYDRIARKLTNGGTTMHLTAGVIYNKDDVLLDPMSMLVTGMLLMIPFTFLPSNPVAWIVKERECGAMHQQRLAGINFYVYWFCNFVFDLAAYLVAAVLIILIFVIFRKEEFVGSDRAGATVIMFVVYGFTSTTMAYFMSFWFSEHSSAQTATMGGTFALAFLLLVVAYVLQLKPETESLSITLRWVFRLVPTFCVGECMLQQILLKQLIAAGQATSIWGLQPFGYALLYLAAECPLFAALTLFLDSPARRKCWQKLKYKRDAPPVLPADEDSDVEDERLAVYEAAASTEDNTDVLRVVDLQKRYANGKMAVKGVTFSIFPGEVFAFLGTNGAGKTTTMSMLCQQFLPSGGSAHINGYDIVEESAEALQCIGYCPQFDATFDLLTVEEHLEYYAALHGVARESRDEVVETLLQLCELTRYRESQAAQLSGGNRRKLSVAISLMGGPEVIFLDEPSAGMDPVARRGMWTTIQRASKHCSVVLTTHHLEEVEALADIVAIMVDGTLRCIGDKIHLKNKFGSGFEMSLRIASEEYCEVVESFVAEHLPAATLNEFKSNRYVYGLAGNVPLSNVFNLLQSNKDYLGICDYCVSQTSIEQVFLRVGESALAREDG